MHCDRFVRFGCKSLQRRTLWHSVAMPMPTSNLLIFWIFLVRDQEVGGSNPLAPTNLKRLYEDLRNGSRGSANAVPHRRETW